MNTTHTLQDILAEARLYSDEGQEIPTALVRVGRDTLNEIWRETYHAWLQATADSIEGTTLQYDSGSGYYLQYSKSVSDAETRAALCNYPYPAEAYAEPDLTLTVHVTEALEDDPAYYVTVEEYPLGSYQTLNTYYPEDLQDLLAPRVLAGLADIASDIAYRLLDALAPVLQLDSDYDDLRQLVGYDA